MIVSPSQWHVQIMTRKPSLSLVGSLLLCTAACATELPPLQDESGESSGSETDAPETGETDDPEAGETDDPPEGDWDDLCLDPPTIGSTACGDGRVGAGEACDDGNDNDNDACTNSCKTTHQATLAFAADARLIEVAPGDTPETATVLLTEGLSEDSRVSAHDPAGGQLWTTEPLGYTVADLAATPDGGVALIGALMPAWDDFRLQLARLDPAGETLAEVELTEGYSLPAPANLVRADGTMVLVGATPNEIYNDNPGVWSFDAALDEQWSQNHWGHIQTADHPMGVVELDDGTLVVGYVDEYIDEGDADQTAGVGFDALDPSTGELLWTNEVGCLDPANSFSPRVYTRLSDETLVVAASRAGVAELLIFDAEGELGDREQWPEVAEPQSVPHDIVADAHGGAYIVGELWEDGLRDSYVAYWHPEHSLRWIVRLGFGASGRYDAALEPDERLWVVHDAQVAFVEL